MVWLSATAALTETTIMQSATRLLGSRTRWVAPTALAIALGFGAMTPAPAHAQDALTRVLVDVADVVFNNGAPYYRYGDYGPANRLVVARDSYGRPVYYRQVRDNRYPYQQHSAYDGYGRPVHDGYGRRDVDFRDYGRSPPYGNAYGYYRHHGDTRCDRDGDRCWNTGRGRHGDDEDRDYRDNRGRDEGDDD